MEITVTEGESETEGQREKGSEKGGGGEEEREVPRVLVSFRLLGLSRRW